MDQETDVRDGQANTTFDRLLDELERDKNAGIGAQELAERFLKKLAGE